MRAAPDVERVAAIVERLAVLLEAGITPASAWQYVSETVRPLERRVRGRPQTDSVSTPLAAASRAARDGEDVSAAIVRSLQDSSAPDGSSPLDVGQTVAWRSVAAAWQVATVTGAPLAQSLRQLAASQRSLGQTQRDIAAALAGPRATSRFVMVLPVLGVFLGLALGFDTVRTLFATLPGAVCLMLGLMLIAVATRWSRSMVRRATPTDAAPGLRGELTAIAVASGVSIERAEGVVAEAMITAGVGGGRMSQARESRIGRTRGRPPASGHDRSHERDSVDFVLALSRRAGIPAADLLRAEAESERRNARSSAQHSAATLGTTLMAPLGLCVLPAFMLLGVAPMMLSVLTSTIGVL